MSTRMLKKFSVYNKKYLKARIKSYNGKVNTNFHNHKIPKEDSQFVCLLVILINSVFKTDKNYYPQIFLEECKCVTKKKKMKKMTKYITDDVGISTNGSDREE